VGNLGDAYTMPGSTGGERGTKQEGPKPLSGNSQGEVRAELGAAPEWKVVLSI
jgi:hypothetical protein